VGGAPPPRVVHLVQARTATGSSARFAAASLCTYLLAQGPEGRLPEPLGPGGAGAAGASPARGSPARGYSPGSRGVSPAKASAAAATAAILGGQGSPPLKRMKRSMSDLGEYRGIISVSRLLPKGTEVKAAVDEAIDRWGGGRGRARMERLGRGVRSVSCV
jgi:hypothetical protein